MSTIDLSSLLDRDALAASVLENWIRMYAQFMRDSPATAIQLKERSTDFELLPVPKAIFIEAALASQPSRSPDPMIGVSPVNLSRRVVEAQTRLDGQEKARAVPELAALVRSFGAALQKGNMADILASVSDDYQDDQGRSKATLERDLTNLVSLTKSRRVIFAHAEDIHLSSSGKFIVVCNGVWEAELDAKDGRDLKSEFFRLEFVFQKEGTASKWKIVSIRHEGVAGLK